MDRRGRARRQANHAEAEAARAGHRHVGQGELADLQGQDIFKGEQQHSSTHPGPEKYRGKKVVVIGSNNSAHDICAALWEGGADVTMVQRSSTHIVKSDTLMDIGLGALYSEQAVANGMTTRKADLIFASLPYKIMHQFQIPLYEQMRERDKDFYAALEKVGFMHGLGRRRFRPVHEVSAPRLGLLHRCRRLRSRHRRLDQAQERQGRGGAGTDRDRRHIRSTAPTSPPTSSSTPPAMAR